MLMKKQLAILTISAALIATAAADMEFRSSSDIQVYSPFNLNTNEIRNLAAPDADGNAKDKDALNVGYGDTLYLERNGDTLEGRLFANGNNITGLDSPKADSDAATKGYVDTEVNSVSGMQNLSEVLTEGNVANQTIDMDSNKIVDLGTPSVSGDVVDVGYLQGNYVAQRGGRLTGDININGNNLRNTAEIRGQNNANDSIVFTSSNIEFTQENSGETKVLTIGQSGNLTVSGSIDANSSKIVDVSDPDNSRDAATKGYVDTEVKGAAGNLSEVLERGSTANQSIDMDSNDIVNLEDPDKSFDAVNRNWTIGRFVERSGDSVNGSIDMLSHDIQNLQDPDSSQDAATKSYVDSEVSGSAGNLSEVLEQGSTANQSIEMSGNDINMSGGNITTGSNEMCLGDSC